MPDIQIIDESESSYQDQSSGSINGYVFADREPRSLQESPSFRPDWRKRQVDQYLRCVEKARSENAAFLFPPEEDDRTVIDFYSYSMGRQSPKSAIFKWVTDCEYQNHIHSAATHIKILTVAGLPDSEIANTLFVSEENITTYKKMFFDVDYYFKNFTRTQLQGFFNMVIVPFVSDATATPHVKKEMGLLYAAFNLSWNSASMLIFRKMDDPDKIIAECKKIASCGVVMKAADYAIQSVATKALGAPGDIDRFAILTSAGTLDAADSGDSIYKSIFAGIESSIIEHEEISSKIIPAIETSSTDPGAFSADRDSSNPGVELLAAERDSDGEEVTTTTMTITKKTSLSSLALKNVMKQNRINRVNNIRGMRSSRNRSS